MKVAIFDMDGTLIDSSVAIERTINEIRADMGLAPLDTEFIVTAINEPGRDLARDLYDVSNPTARLRDDFEEKFRLNYDKYAVAYDGIKELLSWCRASNFAVALASNAPQNTLEAILKRCEILEFFDLVIGADEKIPQKPDPMMLEVVCEYFKTSEAVFVGDSLKDELAAKNANMPYIQVTWGFGKPSQSAHYNAANPAQACEIIKEIARV